MVANQSHDGHVTSSPTTATPRSTPPLQRQHSSDDSTIPAQGEDYPHNIYTHSGLEHPPTTATLSGLTQYPQNSDMHGGLEHPPTTATLSGLTQYSLNSDIHGGLEHPPTTATLSGLTQYPPNPDVHSGGIELLLTSTLSGLTRYPLNFTTPAYSSVMTSSNSDLFVHQHQSQTGATHCVEEPRERELTSYNAPGPNEDMPSPLGVHAPREKSDVFAGTSQAYGAPTNVHIHEGYFTGHSNALNREPALESLMVANHDEYQDHDPATNVASRELEVLSPSLQQMGLRQLGVLFKARGRHIAELTQQISAQAEDNERHIGILRHEKVCCCVRNREIPL